MHFSKNGGGRRGKKRAANLIKMKGINVNFFSFFSSRRLEIDILSHNYTLFYNDVKNKLRLYETSLPFFPISSIARSGIVQ
jgi:hypothetical protein